MLEDSLIGAVLGGTEVGGSFQGATAPELTPELAWDWFNSCSAGVGAALLVRAAANMDAVLVAAARLAAATLLNAPRGANGAAAAGSTARVAAMAPYRSREIQMLLTVRFMQCLLRAGGVSFVHNA
jgi:hypothetical protein